jgi:hypothetical protein
MAMRDPGAPGRNPFFDHDAGEEPDEPVGALPLAPPVDAPGLGPDPLRTLAGLVDALQEAQPEATEHLVAAAHELVLAVKCVVDATEAVLAAQRTGDPPRPAAPRPDPDPDPRSEEAVRRIDLS